MEGSVSSAVSWEFAASGQECHAAGCRQYSRTDDLFQTGGMFGTANDQDSKQCEVLVCCARLRVAVRPATSSCSFSDVQAVFGDQRVERRISPF